MAKVKVKKHINYTYETTDGRSFNDDKKAHLWQKVLDNIDETIMFNDNFTRTKNVDEAFYVHIKNQDQLEAFAAKQQDEGLFGTISEIGYWYYNENLEEYINIDSEITRLMDIKLKMDKGEN